jgi:hypothetical protein
MEGEADGRWRSSFRLVGGFATGGLLAGPCGLFVALKTRADLMPAAKQYPLIRTNIDPAVVSGCTTVMAGSGTAASPIKLDTGDAIAVSNQLENATRIGRNRRMTRPYNATKSVAWKREQLRSGKPPSSGLTFIVDKPNGACRRRQSHSTSDSPSREIFYC